MVLRSESNAEQLQSSDFKFCAIFCRRIVEGGLVTPCHSGSPAFTLTGHQPPIQSPYYVRAIFFKSRMFCMTCRTQNQKKTEPKNLPSQGHGLVYDSDRGGDDDNIRIWKEAKIKVVFEELQEKYVCHIQLLIILITNANPLSSFNIIIFKLGLIKYENFTLARGWAISFLTVQNAMLCLSTYALETRTKKRKEKNSRRKKTLSLSCAYKY